jgi:TolA-binding protein
VIAALAVAVAAAMVALVGVDRLAPTTTTATPRSEALALSEPPATVVRAHGAVRASAGEHFTLLSDAPDEIVRLVEGAITVSVTPLATGERFRVVVGDAEVEVRGTAFEVSAHDDRLESVDVLHGAVEVRLEGHAATLVHAGERWARPVDDELPAATDETATATARAVRPRAPAPTDVEAPVSLAPSWTAASGFEAGWSALHDGDPVAAATAFGEVLDRAPSDPLAEDASFWRAVALSRAEHTTEARAALERFVHTYPRSVRTPEASVMLGWLLLSSGDRDEARAMFERGANDPAERVRASAARGLAAIPGPSIP